MRFKYVVIAAIAFSAYVLGARAGESRYRDIKKAVTGYWNDPTVKKARAKAKKASTKAAKSARKKLR